MPLRRACHWSGVEGGSPRRFRSSWDRSHDTSSLVTDTGSGDLPAAEAATAAAAGEEAEQAMPLAEVALRAGERAGRRKKSSSAVAVRAARRSAGTRTPPLEATAIVDDASPAGSDESGGAFQLAAVAAVADLLYDRPTPHPDSLLSQKSLPPNQTPRIISADSGKSYV